jgi:ubiquinone/menaquinone biosynthesis C-methylase UbiE
MNLEEYERMYRFEDSYWWFVARRKLIASLLRDLNLPGSIDILDIGCGTGAMLDELQNFGAVTGADFSPEALSFCRKRGERGSSDYRLVRADIRSLPFADASFDIVTAMDIVEHIDRDKDAMSEILRVLKPGGRLLATVPAYMELWSEHDDALHHHRRYTAASFRDLARRAGFAVDKLSYTVTALFPLIWLVRTLSRLKRKNGESPKADVVPVPDSVNNLLLSLSNAESALVRRVSLPFGVTVVAVARKAGA